MKTKKALAVLLAAIMLIVPLAVASSAASTMAVVGGTLKTVYYDTEYFNPHGLVISVDGAPVIYTPSDANFRFVPALDELLSVEDTEVTVIYNNQIVGTVTVTVEHKLGELVAIDTGHGKYCLGCGELHEFEAHVVADDAWIPNDDGGIFTPQTMSGKCEICEATVTVRQNGTEKFDDLFPSEENMTKLENTLVDIFKNIVVSLIKMLTGIY